MIILLTITVALLNLCNCCQPAILWKPDGDIQGLTSGSAYIVRQPQQYQSIYDAPVRQVTDGINYQVVSGLSLIEKYSDPDALEYTIRVIKKPALFTILFTASLNAKWTAIIIHYLVSTRSDYFVGDFEVQKEYLQFQPGKERTKYAFQYKYVQKKFENDFDGEAFVFLTGIKSSNRLLGIEIQDTNVKGQNLQIITALSKIMQKIELIRFGYIIYERKIHNFKLSSIFDISSKIAAILSSKESKNQFLGITGINLIGLSSNIREAGRSSSLEDNYFGNFKVEGISFEIGEGPISSYSDNGDKLTKNKECSKLEQCVQEGGILQIMGQQLSCIKCKNNRIYNNRQQKCTDLKKQ